MVHRACSEERGNAPARGGQLNRCGYLQWCLLLATGAGLALAAATQEAGPVPAAAPQAGVRELTRGEQWEYRVLAPAAVEWTADLTPIRAAIAGTAGRIDWPKTWVTFQPWGRDTAGRSDHPAALAKMPDGLTLHGETACRATLPTDERGTLDIASGQGEPRRGRWAYAFATLDAPGDQELAVRVTADGPVAWWLDQKPVASVAEPGDAITGEIRATLRLTLSKGRHLLAARVESSDLGWRLTTAPRHAAESDEPAVEARCIFDVPDTAGLVALTFEGPEWDRTRLNGEPLPVPLPGMLYRQVKGMPPGLLKTGKNELRKAWSVTDARRALAPEKGGEKGAKAEARSPGSLYGLSAAAIAIESGPSLLDATGTSVAVACRTNAPVAVTVEMAGQKVTSRAGLVHVLRVENLAPGKSYGYTLSAAGAPAAAARSGEARTLPESGPVVIGIAGDSRGGPATWAACARGLLAVKPHVVIHSGDIAYDGLDEMTWDRDFFTPAASLLANVPVLAVIGNHERQSALFDQMFTRSLDGRNWTRTMGDVQIVGVDALGDWQPGGVYAKWLDETLGASKAGFVFVMGHYPPYSSSTHGKILSDGRPNEAPTRATREWILPILQKHKVAALFAGHDHCYERSEPPGGVTIITSAGAGAGLYGKRDDPLQNPHSKVFEARHHYCVVRVEGQTATMTVLGTDGKEIETVTWKARGK